MFNHSPQPNVMFTRVAPRESEKDKYPTLTFRTTKPIKKGDELYICYSADESKLWFSPNYVADGNPVESAPEETEWCPPMIDDENELPDSQEPSRVEATANSESSPSADSALETFTMQQNGTGTERTGEQKYLDRKARKQSKREKKVKKAKEDDSIVLQEPAAEPTSDSVGMTAANGSADTNTGDPNSPMSLDEFASALSKLNLIPAIEIQAEDIEREKALATKEQASADPQQDKKNEVAWKQVHRVRGLVEVQEGDEDRTGWSTHIPCDSG